MILVAERLWLLRAGFLMYGQLTLVSAISISLSLSLSHTKVVEPLTVSSTTIFLSSEVGPQTNEKSFSNYTRATKTAIIQGMEPPSPIRLEGRT